MTSVQILDLKGNKVSELNLSDEVFAVKPSIGAVHTALVRQLANARSGSANTKTRAEVRGGGAKPWRQKGTGRARAGSNRSPLWEGGGVIFGPKPRDYSFAMPRKMRLVAIKSALAEKKDNLIVVKDFSDLKEAKTKEALQILKNLEISNRKVLIVLDYASEPSSRFALAARNLANVKVIHANNLNVKDLLNAKSVLTTEGAIEIITKWLQSEAKTANGKPATRAQTKATAKPPSSKESAKAGESKIKDAGLEAKTSTSKTGEIIGDQATPTAKTKTAAKDAPVNETKKEKVSEVKATAAKKLESKTVSPAAPKEKLAKSTPEAKKEEIKSEKKAKPKKEAESKPKRKSTKA